MTECEWDKLLRIQTIVPELMFVDEIDCMDLFPKKDERERIMIFKMEG